MGRLVRPEPRQPQAGPEAAPAAELAEAAGGARALADRAGRLLARGELRLATHLAETAALAAPADPDVARIRAEVLPRRAAAETSTMARGVFDWAAAEAAAVAEGTDVATELTRGDEGRRRAAGVIGVGVVDDDSCGCAATMDDIAERGV